MEQFICVFLWKEARELIPFKQHGFIPKKSTATSLLTYQSKIIQAFNENSQIDAVYTDFSKAFDKVSHHLLIKKLNALNIDKHLIKLISNYLNDGKQCVVMN
jgi:hypothetical protein